MWSPFKKKSDLSVPRKGDGFGYHYDPESFGRFSEKIANVMGTGKFLAIQTVVVVTWILLSIIKPFGLQLDAYPFIMLNLLFSTQAAYAAPLILLAENRKAERDKFESNQDRDRATKMKADMDYIAIELAAIKMRVVSSDDLARVESKLDKLLERAE
jgi:uncharacterized membrane protein